MTILLAIVSALWLVAAPFVFAISSTATWVNVVAALLIGGIALYTELGPVRFYGVALVGVAVVVTSFFLAFAALPLWLNVAAGALAVVTGYLGSRSEDLRRPSMRAHA